MKILQVLDSYPPDLNGGAYFTHRLSRQLTEMGHEVLVICPSRSYRSHYCSYESVKLFRVKSVPVMVYKNFRVSIPVGITKSISNVISAFTPDVVHLQGRFFLGDICMRYAEKNNIPRIATNHFMPENFFHYTGLPRWLSSVFSKLAWRWVKGMFDKAPVWTTPTRSAAELMKKNGFNKKIHVISCGVDHDKYATHAKNENKFFINSDSRPVILYAGRLDKEKNLFVAIDAFSELLQSMPAYFLLVGNGSEKEKLENYVATLELSAHVFFTGYLSDEEYPKVFSIVDCFLHAGTAELQSIVTLEAVAAGLPVVAARAVALPELVQDGLNGFLFGPGNASEAAKHLFTILSDPELKRRMSQESSKISEKHSLASTAVQFLQLYESAIEANHFEQQ